MAQTVKTVEVGYLPLVDAAGYRWVRRDAVEIVGDDAGQFGADELFLVPKFDPERVLREVELPLNLFLTVADILEPTPESILSFANRFGLLSAEYVVIFPDLIPPDGDKNKAAAGADWLGEWEAFLIRLRDALDLAVLIDEARRLGQPIVQWAQRAPEPVADAMHILDLLITQNTRGFALELRHVREHGGRLRPELSFHAESLETALWAQFAAAVAAGKRIHRCLACGRFMTSTPAGERDMRLTCRAACRTQLYLRRRAQAVQMHAAGKSVNDIAAELGIETATVKIAIKAAAAGEKPAARRPRKS